MKIINPLYDKAFKYLMENNRLAKKVLSVILDREIEELTLGQQETVVSDEKRYLTLFRLDFVALIKEADGSKKKVLIELQKSKFETDIQRFRTYLGTHYLKADEVKKIGKTSLNKSYPIITIYILGYKLNDIPYMAVTVNRQILNSVNKKPIKLNSFFIEHLTHNSHIIQVTRLPEKRRTRLEKFLTLFNQACVTENGYILDLKDVPKDFQDIAKYLSGPVMDEEFRRQLAGEEEIDYIFELQEAKYLQKIEEAIQREKEAKQKEEEERKKRMAISIKLAKQLKKHNAPLNEIIDETGLTKEEIDELK
ncbi:MAG: hypothetical protein K8S16_05325 [Bacteroidales bacterium]|nr:hypothetical protein [Bacteroidales bacterium]